MINMVKIFYEEIRYGVHVASKTDVDLGKAFILSFIFAVLVSYRVYGRLFGNLPEGYNNPNWGIKNDD